MGWSDAGMPGHQFRQSQTALTAQAMARDGFRLDYATPVLGKPWSIPMEFPLYQAAVSELADHTGLDIVVAGRWVSVIAFWLGWLGLLLLLNRAGLSSSASVLVGCVVLTTPVMWFYSRAVLIESMAWSASVWFLWSLLRYRESEREVHLGLTLGFGLIAVLVKPTTWAVACLPWAALWLRDLWLRDPNRFRRLTVEAAGIGFPLLLVGFIWVKYADGVKSANPIAHFLISGQLVGFNFGEWEEKLSLSTWQQLGNHWWEIVINPVVLVLGLAVSLWEGRARKLCGLGMLSFLGAQVIFTNLYHAHDYYFYACAVGLVVAVASGLAFWWDRPGISVVTRAMLFGVFLFLLGSQLRLYRSGLFKLQEGAQPPHVGLAEFLRDATRPDDVVVAQMGDWESSLAFYTDRRMLMIPDAQMFYHPAIVDESIALLHDENVAALVVSGEAARHPEWISRRVAQLSLWPEPVISWLDVVQVFVQADQRAAFFDVTARNSYPGIQPLVGSLDSTATEELRIEGAEQEQALDFLGVIPVQGRFPHGFRTGNFAGQDALLVHAPTELYFPVPGQRGTWSFDLIVSPDAFVHRDFDGAAVVVEFGNGSRERDMRHVELFLPGEGEDRREIIVPQVQGAAERVFLSILPGVSGHSAFDQVWLLGAEFESDNPQTTSAK